MGAQRALNGSQAPFKVRWWSVGNEMYGDWQLGHMPLADYVKKHAVFAEAMRAKDPGIELVAVGDVGAWDEAMLAGNAAHMSLISEHFYVQERPGLAEHVAQVPRRIKRIADAHRRYRETIPALAGKNIRIALDEWNYWYGPHLYGELGTRYFLKDALGIAAGIHEYSRQSDIIFMANYAQTVNVIGAIKTTKTAAAFDTTGLVLKLYRAHFGQVPVTISGRARAAGRRGGVARGPVRPHHRDRQPDGRGARDGAAVERRGVRAGGDAAEDRGNGPEGLQRARQTAGGEDRGDERRRDRLPAMSRSEPRACRRMSISLVRVARVAASCRFS